MLLACYSHKHISYRIRTIIRKAINEFNDAIQRIIDKNPELQKRQKILRTVPGIGLKLSQVFVCLMPELGHLNKKEVASLAGVAPHPKESGKTIGYRRITGGRSNVRAKLFTAAMAAARSIAFLIIVRMR